jgi:hypothetical protein
MREIRRLVEGRVNYHGDVVTHKGSTYQAMCDTARLPPHDDWICVAAAGADAVVPQIKGTWKDDKDIGYNFLNIVALNGSSFIAKYNDPGVCPGDGWQLIASAGKPGKPGPRGEQGERGSSGIGLPGRDGLTIKTWKLNRHTYTITPVLSNGEEAEPVCIRSLFEQYNEETGRG